MIDGKYKGSITTPMGEIGGIVSLKTMNSEVLGTIEVMGMKNEFKGIQTGPSNCNFAGNLNTPIGGINYTADCMVMGDSIRIEIKAKQGNFVITGNRM